MMKYEDHPFNKDARFLAFLLFGPCVFLLFLMVVCVLCEAMFPMPINSAGQIVSASWGYYYQGLIAGILGFIAGLTVLCAVFLERYFHKSDMDAVAKRYLFELQDSISPFLEAIKVPYIEGTANGETKEAIVESILKRFLEEEVPTILSNNEVLVRFPRSVTNKIKNIREQMEAFKGFSDNLPIVLDEYIFDIFVHSFWRDYHDLFAPEEGDSFSEWRESIPQRYFRATGR